MRRLGFWPACAALCLATGAQAQTAVPARPPETIVVTASRVNLLGRASTASQGSITQKEIALRPAFRVGQLLESVPGLVVSIHSGEGKAAQFLARGFNLDHGTDLANFVDDIPINRPSNAHGQGYSDLNFLIPETFAGLDYTKGTYYASIGDFSAVASEHLRLADDLPNQVIGSVGTLGDERIAATGTYHQANGNRLSGAIDFSHVDGPFDPGKQLPQAGGRGPLCQRHRHGRLHLHRPVLQGAGPPQHRTSRSAPSMTG